MQEFDIKRAREIMFRPFLIHRTSDDEVIRIMVKEGYNETEAKLCLEAAKILGPQE